jgi:hypothetical protein
MVILNRDAYCDYCGAYLPDKDDFVEFRRYCYCDIDCWEKYLVKNSIRYPYGVLFNDEMYNSFDHLYIECYDETIQR